MGKLLWHTMMSLDGFIAGPNDDMSWAFGLDAGSGETVDRVVASTGALLVGRRTQDVEDRLQPGFYGGAFRGPFFVMRHDPEWYENIESAEWLTGRPLAVNSRFRFTARFLGRQLAYTYEVRRLVPGERLVMSTDEGRFPMETTYTWSDADPGTTRMMLRNRGEPAGFARIATPVLEAAMRRANRKDLERLKRILEAAG